MDQNIRLRLSASIIMAKKNSMMPILSFYSTHEMDYHIVTTTKMLQFLIINKPTWLNILQLPSINPNPNRLTHLYPRAKYLKTTAFKHSNFSNKPPSQPRPINKPNMPTPLQTPPATLTQPVPLPPSSSRTSRLSWGNSSQYDLAIVRPWGLLLAGRARLLVQCPQ